MSLPRHLSSAPIVEGIIDIQVKGSRPWPLDAMKTLAGRFAVAAKIEQMHTLALHVVQAVGKPPSQTIEDSGPIGLRCFSGDGRVIVQLRRNGFTFSRLHPYTSWDEIFPHASEIVRAYIAEFQPEEVTRIAVRNINRLLLPAAAVASNPERFFTYPPSFPKSDGAVTAHWMTRFMLKRSVEKLDAIVTHVTEDELLGDKLPIILDIDVFDAGPLPLDADELLSKFAELRAWKNRLFFGALTEESLSLFA
ncbi:MAG: TIGR04255 family protein [Opitutaceae bacterium]|nr:TIGR04255 family protein [Opitutaceae bacterium]